MGCLVLSATWSLSLKWQRRSHQNDETSSHYLHSLSSVNIINIQNQILNTPQSMACLNISAPQRTWNMVLKGHFTSKSKLSEFLLKTQTIDRLRSGRRFLCHLKKDTAFRSFKCVLNVRNNFKCLQMQRCHYLEFEYTYIPDEFKKWRHRTQKRCVRCIHFWHWGGHLLLNDVHTH